jgi:beta-carotene 3-hydroxylase
MENWGPLLAGVAAFVLMEGAAWAAHKYLMHGWLWFLHADHHTKEPGFFEKNDAFFLIFAVPSWLCIMLGMMNNVWVSVGFGFGIAAYGLAYFFVHELFIHQRFRWIRNIDTPYFRAVRRLHKMHHKVLTKEESAHFGMLWVPRQLIREEAAALKREQQRAQHQA